MSEPEGRATRGTILGRAKPHEAGTVEAGTVEAAFEALATAPLDAPSEPAEPARETRVSAGGLVRWSFVGCVVLALASLAFALLALQQRSALKAQRDQTSELRDVSGRTIAALTSYDYQHLDQWKQSVLADATGSFQNQFTTSFTGFEQAYVAEHNRGTGAIQGVWVGPVDAGKATSVVLVQITVTSLSGTHSLEPYVQVTLLKVAGRWRVDDVQATFDTSGGSATSTTPTTVTPPASTGTTQP